MAGNSMVQQLAAYFTPIIDENHLELADIEFVKEGPNWYLRVYIDKKDGITIDDCELVSRSIEKILDEKDPISQAYILEVSSPGIDRPLKKDSDYEKYKGEIVDIKLYKAVNKIKEYQGTLQGLTEGVVTIVDDTGKVEAFQKVDIASCRLAVIF